MTKMRKRILGLGCAAVFAFSQVPLALHVGSLGASADAVATVALEAYDGNGTKTVQLEDGKLPALPAPEREGYDFVGWFTAPVEVEFWGDKADETWCLLKKTYGTDYTYLNGRPISWYNEGEKPDPRYADNAGYDWKNARWVEHSLGLQNATKGQWVHEGDTVSAGSTLYAMYDPKNITVYWYSNGWKGINDTEYASTGRSTGFEYGGKFARLPLDRWAKWEGNHEFKGWADADGNVFEFDMTYAGEMLKDFYTPEKYEPILRLYAIYDDITKVGGSIKPAEFKGLTGGGRTFDPDLGSHTFTATFDSKNKALPENMGWELTSGSDHFDLTVSKDKTVATVTAKDKFKKNLPNEETVAVKFSPVRGF